MPQQEIFQTLIRILALLFYVNWAAPLWGGGGAIPRYCLPDVWPGVYRQGLESKQIIRDSLNYYRKWCFGQDSKRVSFEETVSSFANKPSVPPQCQAVLELRPYSAGDPFFFYGSWGFFPLGSISVLLLGSTLQCSKLKPQQKCTISVCGVRHPGAQHSLGPLSGSYIRLRVLFQLTLQ